MIFETYTQVTLRGSRTVYPVFLAGFHDSRRLDGEVFLNPQRAYSYCENKVIHVKEVPFYSQQEAESFVRQMAWRSVNHCHALGVKLNLEHHECEEFKKVLIEVMDE